ncbi:hypothetical protein SEA_AWESOMESAUCE_78 [Mycobacterium phage Awesomesauce]|nr:hypothetical protein SEA_AWESOMESAUCE_78 [Mycobacterium phage Awesomesauce]
MPDRIKVVPVRAANGRIQGWAVNGAGREIAFFTAWRHGRLHAHERAMDMAQRIARGDR